MIRVGDDYVMVASSFHFSPGLPVLTSKDLVHWSIAGHALPRLPFNPAYDLPGPLNFDDASERARLDPAMGHRYSAGVWAPAIRHHGGRYYIYFATPTDGIFMVSAEKPEGPWTAPVALVAQAGFEDPCPFWDDDGSAWLVHSKVGAGPLVLRRMTPDGTRVLDEGTVIVEDPVNLPVLEGPKLLKRNGWYYIFAPYGGVEKGPQAVLRARDIHGPYEWRTVLAQGDTAVQAPHQGGYVETPSGGAGSPTSTAPAPTAASSTCSRCAGSTTGRSSANRSPPPADNRSHATRCPMSAAPGLRCTRRPPMASTDRRWACSGSGTTTRSMRTGACPRDPAICA